MCVCARSHSHLPLVTHVLSVGRRLAEQRVLWRSRRGQVQAPVAVVVAAAAAAAVVVIPPVTRWPLRRKNGSPL